MLPLVLDQVSFVVNGRTIIDGISMEISEGPRTVILGPNGAGKSVLMRLCHGLLRPDFGQHLLARQRRAAGGRPWCSSGR